MRFLLVTLLCVTLCTPTVLVHADAETHQQQHQQEEQENKKWSFTQALNDAKAELEGLKPTIPPKTPQQLAAEAAIADRLHSMVAGIQREPAFDSIIRQVNNVNTKLFTKTSKLFGNNNGKLWFNKNSPKLWMNERRPRYQYQWKKNKKWNWHSPKPQVQKASFKYFDKVVNYNKQSEPAAFDFAKLELNNNKQSQPSLSNFAKIEFNNAQKAWQEWATKPQAQESVEPTVATTMVNGEVYVKESLPSGTPGPITPGKDYIIGNNDNLKPATVVSSTSTVPFPLNPQVHYSVDSKGNLRPAPVAPADPITPVANNIVIGSRQSQQPAPITITQSSIDTTIYEPEIDITNDDLIIRALDSIALETDAKNEMNVDGDQQMEGEISQSKDATTTTTTNTNTATDTATNAVTNTATNTATTTSNTATDTATNTATNAATDAVTNTAINTATSTCAQGTSCPYDTRPSVPRSGSFITGYFKFELPSTQVQDVQPPRQWKSSRLRKLQMRIPGMSSSMEFINWLYDRVRRGGSRTRGLSRMELEQLTWWCDKHATPCPSCPNVMHDWIQPTLIENESEHEGEGVVDSVGGIVNPMVATLCPRECVCPGVNGVPWYIRPAAIVPGLPPLKPVATSLLEMDADADTEATSETDTQAETDVTAEAEADTETAAQTEAGADAEAQIETHAEAEAETEAAAETQTETEAGAEAATETEAQTETEAGAEAESTTEVETEAEAGTEAQAQTQAMSQAQVMEQMDATVEVGSEADWG